MYYMGKDKYENEDLIKYGLPEDVWFHVDDLSSAHVYVRMTPGMVVSDLPESVIQECASLVKANSIAGCKVRKLMNNTPLFAFFFLVVRSIWQGCWIGELFL